MSTVTQATTTDSAWNGVPTSPPQGVHRSANSGGPILPPQPRPVPGVIPVAQPVPQPGPQFVASSVPSPLPTSAQVYGARSSQDTSTSHGWSARRSYRGKRLKFSLSSRRVHWLTLGYLLVVMLVSLGIEILSETWWLTAAIVYAPRQPWLIPAVALVAACVRWNQKLIPVALMTVLFAAGPIMGFRTGGYFAAGQPGPAALRIVSCNIHSFEPDFPEQMAEISAIQPDVVAFQEAFRDHPLRGQFFAGWKEVRADEYYVAAKHPLTLVGQCESPAFNRIAAIAARVDDPAGSFLVVNIHLTTARYGLMKLKPATLLGKDGIGQLRSYIMDREEEALAVRQWIEGIRGDLPLVVLGDFNMPVDSNIQSSCFGDLINCFDEIGVGYGYTAPNQTSTWPAHFPWIRVDHVLVSLGDWEIHRAWSGRANGSDHRLTAAIIERHDGSKY
jgi:vancomycin resistance protein VanJ